MELGSKIWIYHWVLWYGSNYHAKALMVGPRKVCLDLMVWQWAVAAWQWHPEGQFLGEPGAAAVPKQTPGRAWGHGQCRQSVPRSARGPHCAGLPGKITEVNSHPGRWVCIFAAPLIMKWARRKLFLFIRTEIVCKVLKIKEATAGYFICF